MIAASSASILIKRISNLPSIRSVLKLNRCFATDACNDKPQPNPHRKELKLEPKLAPMKAAEKINSIWENPECCLEECEHYRHDILFLKDTKRTYTRTWNECEDVVKEKYICVGEILPPEVEKRPRRAGTTKGSRKQCVGDEFKLDLMKCKQSPKIDIPCPKIRMPGCGEVRDPPTCPKFRPLVCCQKRCTLYPAYSECKKPKPKIQRPVECSCLRVPSACEVFAMFRKFPMK